MEGQARGDCVMGYCVMGSCVMDNGGAARAKMHNLRARTDDSQALSPTAGVALLPGLSGARRGTGEGRRRGRFPLRGMFARAERARLGP